MHLRELLSAAGLADGSYALRARATGAEGGGAGPLITDVAIASGGIQPGALFACIKGGRADGHDHAAEAVQRGAVALLCERSLPLRVPQVVVSSVRQAIGPVAAAFWGSPSAALRLVGVTGTNGKTTTCALLAGIFQAQGWRPGVIGTLTGERTTPEAPDLQKRLAEFVGNGSRAAAMEVSSHALDQYRVGGTRFAAGVFTNLSQDHLDYHGTMEAYFAAKKKLFTRGQVDIAVVNQGDPWGQRLAEELVGSRVKVVTFSLDDAREVVLGQRSASFSWRGERLQLSMGGRFNIANALAAATTARELGVGWDAVVGGLAAVEPVRGRFQVVQAGQPFAVLVDFAHTPAALEAALQGARELAGQGRVIVVFGAGGDRDRSKRPLMGAVAGALADVVIITSDNPRSEKPLAIIEEVASGLTGAAPLVDADRAAAVRGALAMAAAGDVVLIAGKGHELGQDFGGHVEPFDDVEVARQALVDLGQERSWVGAS